MTNMKVVDSLIGNEFALELGEQRVSGVFRVSGFVSYSKDDDGTRHTPPFEISKTVERDAHSPFNAWLRETLAERHSKVIVTRDLVLLAIDDGIITRRWVVKGAHIHQVRYSEFDSASFEMVAETYVIHYADIEESFPASS